MTFVVHWSNISLFTVDVWLFQTSPSDSSFISRRQTEKCGSSWPTENDFSALMMDVWMLQITMETLVDELCDDLFDPQHPLKVLCVSADQGGTFRPCLTESIRDEFWD